MRLLIFSFFALLIACKNNTTSSCNKEFNNDTIQFFQVSNFIQSQLDEIRKTPFFIYKKKTANNKQDSISINTQELMDLAKPFLLSDITTNVKKFYKESAFEDLSTKSITFNYSTTKTDLPIQNIDVLLNQETQDCKRIFIKKFFNSGDTTYSQQLNWKANESFQIINSYTTSKILEAQTNQIVVVWINNNLK